MSNGSNQPELAFLTSLCLSCFFLRVYVNGVGVGLGGRGLIRWGGTVIVVVGSNNNSAVIFVLVLVYLLLFTYLCVVERDSILQDCLSQIFTPSLLVVTTWSRP